MVYMGGFGNINDYMAQNQQQQQIKPSEAAAQAMSNMQKPTLQQSVQQDSEQRPVLNSNPMAVAEQVNLREKTLQNLDKNDFKARQKDLNASDKEYWGAKLKQNPESSYSILREYFASNETPEEKAKRERRDALGETFRNLGNVIGNAANLYYAHRSGTPIDLNTANEKHNERIRQLKEKQDAIQRQREQMFVNAKIDDIKNKRAKALAEAKTKAESTENALKHQRDLIKLQIENMYKLGQIDAQTKADLLEQTQKTKDAKELASIKHQHSVKLKQAPTYKDLNGGKKKSTYTYAGVEYNKKDLSSMVNLYNKLREDGYALPKIKVKNLNQYVDAIANLMGTGTWNMDEFAPLEQKVPDIVDSDIVSSNGGVEKWKPDYDEEWTSK